MYHQGGNAIDAALASAITLTVVEPCSNGLGSDAFAIVWDGRQLHGLNASGKSPQNLDVGEYQGLSKIEFGWHSITVPGCVDAWSKLSRRFGRLKFEKLFEPALAYAQKGFAVSPTIYGQWLESQSDYRAFNDFQEFFYPNGQPPKVGEVFCPMAMHGTLERIAQSHGDDFYRGKTTRCLVDYLQGIGAPFTAEDFDQHQSLWVDLIQLRFGEVDLYEIPPNGQGIAALIALGILKQTDIDHYPVDSVDSVHLQVEAMKIAFQIIHAEVADPEYMRVSTDTLLSEARLKALAEQIDMSRARDMSTSRGSDGGTVYLTTADQDGMMVSFIQSNYCGFGSGIVEPTTGVHFQNRAAGFSLKPDHPNVVAPDKRPFHTIIPGFVMRDGKPLMSFGVMGAHMQAQGHVQMMIRIFCHGQNPQAASDAPRWYVDHDYNVVLESGYSHETKQGLISRGHHIGDSMSTGGAQLIYRLDNGYYCAASDHRKDGHAAGF